MLGAGYAVASDKDYLELSLEELMSVKVTGVSLREQDAKQIPASVTIFTEKSIRMLGVKTLHELLRFVPGFQVYRSDDSINPSIVTRGKTVGNSSREILLMLDGVRVDNWLDGGSAGLGRIPLFNVERIEFIRGPVSQIYGANAFQGVINIITHEEKNSLHLAVGSLKGQQVSGNVALQSDQMQHVFSIDYYTDEGDDYTVLDPFNPNREVDIYDQVESVYASYKLIVPDWELSAFYKNNRSEGFYGVSGYHPDFTDFQFEYSSANAKHEKQWTELLQTRINFGAKTYKNFREVAIVGEGQLLGVSQPPSSEPLNSFLNVDGEGYWFNADLLFNLNESWIYQLGYEYRYDELEDVFINNNYNIAQLANYIFPVEYYGNFDNKSMIIPAGDDNTQGVFGQLSYISDSFEISVGARNDDSPLAGSNLSPRFSAIHFVNHANTVKLVYGEAFRVPGANEYYLMNNPVVVGNPVLEAETVATTEIIWLYNYEDTRVQASLYENRFDGTIVQGQPDGERRYANAGKSSNRGVEFTLLYPFSESWAFRTSFSKIIDMLPEAFRLSDTQANVMLHYHRNKWNAVFDVAYVSERAYIQTDTSDPQSIGAYELGNAYVAYSLSDAVTLSLGVQNITDEQVFAPSTGDSQDPIPQRGRQVSFSIDWML